MVSRSPTRQSRSRVRPRKIVQYPMFTKYDYTGTAWRKNHRMNDWTGEWIDAKNSHGESLSQDLGPDMAFASTLIDSGISKRVGLLACGSSIFRMAPATANDYWRLKTLIGTLRDDVKEFNARLPERGLAALQPGCHRTHFLFLAGRRRHRRSGWSAVQRSDVLFRMSLPSSHFFPTNEHDGVWVVGRPGRSLNPQKKK